MSRLMSLRSRLNDLATSSSKISAARAKSRASGAAGLSMPFERYCSKSYGLIRT